MLFCISFYVYYSQWNTSCQLQSLMLPAFWVIPKMKFKNNCNALHTVGQTKERM